MLDRSSGEWKKLADGVDGNDLAWAPDSRFLYASSSCGGQPALLRISLEDDKVDPVVDLSDFSKLNGRVDTSFAVAPNNGFPFLRIVAGYGLSYE